MTKVTISRYEAGRVPDVETLKNIADYGGVTVEWLLHGDRPAPQLLEHAPDLYDARPLPPLAFPLLVEVVAAADAYLARRRLKRSIIQRARLYVLLYEHCAENKERPDDALVEKYLVLAD